MEEITERLIGQVPPALAGALAHWLREEGVEVDREPPLETRNLNTALALAAVILAASGNFADIRAGIQKFRERFSKSGGQVQVVEERGAVGRRLHRLDDLLREGVITKEEYTEQRERILREL